MQVPVLLFYKFGRRKVNRGYSLQRQEYAAKAFYQRIDGFAVASYHAFERSVDYQQRRALGAFKGHAHIFGGPVYYAQDPVRLFVLGHVPEAPGNVAGPGKVAYKKAGLVDPAQHLVPRGPGPRREKPGRFSQAVAYDESGLNSQGAYQVAYGGAVGYRAEDHRFKIVGDLPFCFVLPAGIPEEAPRGEIIRDHLAAQIAVLGVEAPRDLRPLSPEFPAHADILVAGSRENESYVFGPGLACGGVKYPVPAESAVRGGPYARGRRVRK